MSLATDTMTFSQHLVLWLHVAFVIFTLGPVALAISSTPRYIRQQNIQVVRYLSRITFILMIGSLGVLFAGVAIGQMLKVASKPWLIVSATLFLVSIVLLVLIVRDQRRAIRALEEAAQHAAEPAAGQAVATTEADQAGPQAGEPGTAEQAGPTPPPVGHTPPAHHLATVERGRIAMLGGVVNLIYLVILVLMVWNS
jgi:uncharacterized membrane protein